MKTRFYSLVGIILGTSVLCFAERSFGSGAVQLVELNASFYENATWKKIWRLEVTSDGEARLSYTPNALTTPTKRIEKERNLTDSERQLIAEVAANVEQGEIQDITDGIRVDGPVFNLSVSRNDEVVGSVSIFLGSLEGESDTSKFLSAWDQLSSLFPRYRIDPRDYELKDTDQNLVVEPAPVFRAPKFGRRHR